MPIKTIGTVTHVHAAPKKPGCAQPKAGATPRIRAVPPDEHRPQFRVGSIYGPRAAVVPLQRHGNNPLQNTRLSLFPSSAVIVLRNLAIRNQPTTKKKTTPTQTTPRKQPRNNPKKRTSTKRQNTPGIQITLTVFGAGR